MLHSKLVLMQFMRAEDQVDGRFIADNLRQTLLSVSDTNCVCVLFYLAVGVRFWQHFTTFGCCNFTSQLSALQRTLLCAEFTGRLISLCFNFITPSFKMLFHLPTGAKGKFTNQIKGSRYLPCNNKK